MKYFCGRKHKYGLNMQAVCDHNGRFLDVSIMYGGASSDILAFEASALYGKLKHDSLLAPGLCLFGDNAYLNSSFMATPYAGKVTKEQDAYNYYHSQVRIKVEGSFGRLVNRWGFLQKKYPNITLLPRLYQQYCVYADSTITARMHHLPDGNGLIHLKEWKKTKLRFVSKEA